MNEGEVGATAAEAYEKLVKANDAWLKERFNRGIEMERYPIEFKRVDGQTP